MSTIRYSEGELPIEFLPASEVNEREWPLASVMIDSAGDYWIRNSDGSWHVGRETTFVERATVRWEPYKILPQAKQAECNCGISSSDLKKLFESSTDKEALAKLKSYAGIATPREGEVWVVSKKEEPGEMVLGFSEGYFSHFKDSPVFYIPQELTLIKRLWPEEQ